jgi:hypothetical protein
MHLLYYTTKSPETKLSVVIYFTWYIIFGLKDIN